MSTPVPFADDSGTRAYRANVNTCRTPTPRFPIWRFLFAAAALPPLLVFLAALAALIRRHMGIGFGAALSLVAVVGFVVLAWVVFAVVASALVAGGWRGQWTRSQRHTTRVTVIHK